MLWVRSDSSDAAIYGLLRYELQEPNKQAGIHFIRPIAVTTPIASKAICMVTGFFSGIGLPTTALFSTLLSSASAL